MRVGGVALFLVVCVCAVVAFDRTKILEDLREMKNFIAKVENDVAAEPGEGEAVPVENVEDPNNSDNTEEDSASSEEPTEEEETGDDEASAAAPTGGPGQPCNNNPGTCGKPANCKGSIVSGKCNGGSDNVCCVTGGSTGGKTTTGAWPPAGCRPLGNFEITHYTFALEADPRYAKDPLVSAPGLTKKYKSGFLGGATGVKMQGTGLAMDGQYIKYVNGRYSYGIGGARGAPEAWKTVAVDPSVIPLGKRISIKKYADKGPLLAKDTGGAIKGKHIDYFIGAVTIAQAWAHGKTSSEVCIYN